MAKIGKLIWALLLLSGFTRAATAGVLTGELDNPSGTLDDQFVYTLSIQGSFDGSPEFPKVDGLDVAVGGKSQNVSIINGKYSHEVQIQFILSPQKAGNFAIPPIKLTVDGKAMETLPLELLVSASGSPRLAPSANGRSGAGAGAGAQAQGDTPGLFIERKFSKNTAYVGEAIGVNVKVFSRIKVVGAQKDFRYPSVFQVKDKDNQKSNVEVVNGQEYNVTELESVIIANREGEFTIDPAILIARVAVQRRSRSRSFFDDLLGPTDLQEKRLRSESQTLKVLPLPTAGRRKDYSGLVGAFKLSGDLNPRESKVGDTLNLSLILEGQGSSSGMADPTLPFDTKLAKVYKDKADYHEELDAARGIDSTKTFRYAIVPERSGPLNLGQVTIQVFNPLLAIYEDLKFDMGTVQIEASGAVASAPLSSASTPTAGDTAPAADTALPKPEQKAVEVMAKDLVEPHSQSQLRGSDIITSSDWTNGGLALSLSLIGLVSTGVLAYRRKPETENARMQRANKAFKHSKKHLDFAQQCLRKQDLPQALKAAQTCFKDYTGAKFGVTSAAVTLRDMESYLRSRSVSRETLHELREVWSALDQMIYAPPLGQNPTRGEELLTKSRRVLEQMERQCGRS